MHDCNRYRAAGVSVQPYICACRAGQCSVLSWVSLVHGIAHVPRNWVFAWLHSHGSVLLPTLSAGMQGCLLR